MSGYLKRLESEIRNQAATVANDVTMRREHPSYGYTKTAARRDLAQLEGMLTAWLIMTGRWNAQGAVMLELRADSFRELDIDLAALRKYVEES